MRNRPRWRAPHDLAEQVRASSATKVAAQLGVSHTAVYNALRRAGIDPVELSRRPAPDDWHMRAPYSSRIELQRIYHAGPDTLMRWERETGVSVRAYGPASRVEHPCGLCGVTERAPIMQTARIDGVLVTVEDTTHPRRRICAACGLELLRKAVEIASRAAA